MSDRSLPCYEVRTLIPFMLDDELSPTEKDRVLHHAEHCNDCQFTLEEELAKRYLDQDRSSKPSETTQ